MNAYQNLYHPWRSAFQVWSVLAQAQTEFALRLMGMTAPRSVVRRQAPVAAPLDVPASEAAPDQAPVEPTKAGVVPLRLVNEASAAATAAEIEALPETDPESDAIAALEPAREPAIVEPAAVEDAPVEEVAVEEAAVEDAVTAPALQAEAEADASSDEAEADASSDLVQAAVQSLLAAKEEETAAEVPAALASVAKAHGPLRRSATGSRRTNKAKRP